MGAAAIPIATAAYSAYQGHQASQDAKQASNKLTKFAKEPYEGMQGWLPPELRSEHTGPIIGQGMAGIGSLIRNPGQVSSQVGSSIAPALANQSQAIGQQFREQGQNEAGAAGAADLPAHIKALLEASRGVREEGAQRGATEQALGATDQQKRADLEQTYQLLSTILQFIGTGRGQALPGLVQKAQSAGEAGQRDNAAYMAMLASMLQSQGQGG